ncbi:MAG: macro domain-containing protein [Nitrospirae bacterium]|nr:macro domain-containing protein [Nitrospirota bacterium]
MIAHHTIAGKTLRLIQGDITHRDVDAIVNAANSSLQHGGGVAGAIVRKGGQVIQDESNKIAPVAVGHAAITGAGRLPAKFVIHAVGPMMGEGDEDSKLKNAIMNSLKLASENKLSSISFPAISAGIFGFPKGKCAKLLIGEAVTFLKKHKESSLADVEFCIYDDETLDHFKKEFDKLK